MNTGYIVKPLRDRNRLTAIESTDNPLFSQLRQLFGLAVKAKGDIDYRIAIERQGSLYRFLCNGVTLSTLVDHAGVVAHIESILEKWYRTTEEGLVTIHSFGAEASGTAFAITGISGAGKTTLGLACALAGFGFMGDEYGYLDCMSGLYWHAQYPLSVKEPVTGIAPTASYENAMLLTKGGVTCSFVPARSIIDSLNVSDAQNLQLPLRAFLLPRREPGIKTPIAHRAPIASWPKLLMPSVAGEGSRDSVFRRTLGAVSGKGIAVVELVYSEAESAARWLWNEGLQEIIAS